MMVEGSCKSCNKWFDAHWHNYPPGDPVSCPYCKSPDVRTSTDEDYSEENVEVYDDEDD